MNEADGKVPCILDETDDFAVVYKPPRMHCAPLQSPEQGTLLDWYAGVFPPVLDMRGRKEGEGGLVHRLDFETQGLVLFAKTPGALAFLLARQDEGCFVKEYSAVCVKAARSLPGFPPPPVSVFPRRFPVVIKSFFRPFGPGRKQVRPVTGESRPYRKIATDKGGCYLTEISGVSEYRSCFSFTVKLKRGFRHQIRCHLAWLGYPVLHDPLYKMPPDTTDGFLALRSHALLFPDPRTGEGREYRIEQLAGFSYPV